MRCHNWLLNADFRVFFPSNNASMHSFPKPKSDVIRLTLSWKSGIDILFSFCIKQWDKFKLDYSEQD